MTATKKWLDNPEEGERADFSDCDMEGVNLCYATLRLAYLLRANLTGANLAHANLYGANLLRSNLKGANLEEANLEGVIGYKP